MVCHGRANIHQMVGYLSLLTCLGYMVTGMNEVPGKQASYALCSFCDHIYYWEYTLLSKIKTSPCLFGTSKQMRRQISKESQKCNTMATMEVSTKQWTGLWEQVPLSPASHMADDGRHSHHDYTLSVPIPWCSIWYSGSNDPVVLTVFLWVLLSLEKREM